MVVVVVKALSATSYHGEGVREMGTPAMCLLRPVSASVSAE